MSDHQRNTGPMHAAALCGAKRRNGLPCGGKAMREKKRCRLHGGLSPGAPLGNTRARKHGHYSQASLEEDRKARELLAQAEALLARLV